MSQVNDGRGRSARSRNSAHWLVLALVLPATLAPGTSVALDGEGPLPKSARSASTHAPYTSGDCALCHDLKKGAPPPERGDNLCLSCHEDAKRTHVHAPRKCTRCHNSHDSTRTKLLRGDLANCKECHAQN